MRTLLALVMLWLAALPVRADSLAETVRAMAATPTAAGVIDLAAHLETAGHWQLANRAGARFTASLPASGNADELARAIAALAPDLSRGEQRLVLHLSEPTVFAVTGDDDIGLVMARYKPTLRALIGGKSYPVVRTKLPTSRRAFASIIGVRPGIGLMAPDRATFRATELQLTRAFPKSAIRIVAFDPAGPAMLSVTPRIDPQTKEALVDVLAPAHASAAIGGLNRQMIIVSGRLEAGKLLTKAANAPEVALDVDALVRAAAAADNVLVLLDTGSAAQPGGRNLLWLPVAVPGLAKAGEAPSLADVLHLASGRRALQIKAADTDGRLVLSITREDDLVATETSTRWSVGTFKLGRWADKLSDVAADLIGRAPARVMLVSLPSPTRQAELDRRLIKALPSWLQYGYASLLLLGLLGAPTAWTWFGRVWPQEQASEYAIAAGYHAARAVRAAVFAVVFMPLAAMVAAPAQLLRLVRRSA